MAGKTTMSAQIRDFLAQKNIAVAGVSRSSEGRAANAIYNRLKNSTYQVYAVNPNAETVEGDPCYPNLKAIPIQVDGVVIVTKSMHTESIVRECSELGIPRVWMHRSFGQGSVSEVAVKHCEENGISVIAGGCPMMFCEPVDFAHKWIRWLSRISGGTPR